MTNTGQESFLASPFHLLQPTNHLSHHNCHRTSSISHPPTGGGAHIRQHRTQQERIASGRRFLTDFSLPAGFEVVYDTMGGEGCDRYDAWPERLYVVVDGVVVYKVSGADSGREFGWG